MTQGSNLSIQQTRERIKRTIDHYLESRSTEPLGFGLDPYYEHKSIHHPMAYGLFTNALSKMARITGDNRYRLLAIDCLQKLIKSRKIEPAWGLAFAHNKRPTSQLYGITTAIVGAGIRELARTNHSQAKQEYYSIAKWLSHSLPWTDFADHTSAPWFGPGYDTLATNVASKIGAYLFAVGNETNNLNLVRQGTRALNYVLRQQEPAGYWIYGKSQTNVRLGNRAIDQLHTAYILEGLLDYAANKQSMITRILCKRRYHLLQAIDQGLKFYSRKLFDGQNVLEKAVMMTSPEVRKMHLRSSKSRSWRIETSLDINNFLVIYPDESRLWGYGEALAVFAKASFIEKRYLKLAIKIFLIIEKHLCLPNGCFKYKTDDNRNFVRHEAHLVYGLATLYDKLTLEANHD